MPLDPRLSALNATTPEGIDADIARVTSQLKAVGTKQDEIINQDAPRGKFSKASLARLATVLNKFFSTLGLAQEVQAPTGDLTIFPPDLASAVLMVSAAVNDAVKESVLDAELIVDPAGITSDDGIRDTIAKFTSALNTKEFKRWLTSEQKPEVEAEEPVESVEEVSEEPTEQDIMAMYAKRA